jgi:hypothetical protein
MEDNNKKNNNLAVAKAKKGDEFYTRLSDIENELKHYKEHFLDKVVYCNCDGPEWSNFFIYFRDNFKHLGLKKLISTHYSIDITKDKASKLECVQYTLGADGLPVPNKIDLIGDGDFRSEECIQFLKQADIVCTNPPFSLFREYVAQLVEYDKKFLIIGSMNAITYKDIFGHILNSKVWLGNTDVKVFLKPNGEIKEFGNICWFTNLNHNKRNEKVILWRALDKTIHQYYDDYNILNVNKVSDIPLDYKDLMGVPITYLSKHNPNQFEILGIANSSRYIGVACKTVIDGKKIYNRIIIKAE